MDHAEFQEWLLQASCLTRSQKRKAIAQISEGLPKSRPRGLKIVEKPETNGLSEVLKILNVEPICPSCQTSGAYLWGMRSGLQRY